MDDDHIGVEAIDSRRKHEVEAESMDRAIPRAPERIQKKPGEKFQEMRTGDRWNLVPENGTGGWRTRRLEWNDRQIFHALGVEMDFAAFAPGEALKHFGKRALRAMAPVNEG